MHCRACQGPLSTTVSRRCQFLPGHIISAAAHPMHVASALISGGPDADVTAAVLRGALRSRPAATTHGTHGLGLSSTPARSRPSLLQCT